MVTAIKIVTDEIAEIGDFCEQIESDYDLSDHQQLVAAAPLLRRLANNKALFRQAAMQALTEAVANPQVTVTPASIVLSPHAYRRFLVRANLWPVLHPDASRSTEEVFSYGLKHDHTFSFATVNYFGPGYRTDIWTNPSAKHRAMKIGDVADLEYQGQFQLCDDMVLCFERLADVHIQYQPIADSVSLNLVVLDPREHELPQHRFDESSGRVTGYPNGSPLRTKLIFARLLAASDDPALVDVMTWAMKRIDCEVHRAAISEARNQIINRISQ